MGSCISVDNEPNTASTASRKHQSPANTSGHFKYQRGTCALEYWEPLQELGEGSISSIHLVQRRPERVDIPYKERVDIMSLAKKNKGAPVETPTTVKVFALKSIMKDHVQNDVYLEEMRNEIYTMSHLDHPNIAKVYEAYERKRHIYLIMDYCSGGDLEGREPNEAEASCIVRKILLAVEYLHAHNVVHRDLKLENVMFSTPTPDAEIKLIDFGLATRYLSDDYKNMTGTVGTLYSLSPQVLQGKYDFKCDLWSVGVIAYILLSGVYPFWGPPQAMSWEKRRKIMMDRIMRGQYTKMVGPRWEKVSPEAKLFVRSLLQIDPKKRPTASVALKSPWMKKTANLKVEFRFPHHKQYIAEMELKRHARNLIGEKLTAGEIVELRCALEKIDEENAGEIGRAGFAKALSKTRLSKDDIDSLLSQPESAVSASFDYVNLINTILESKSRRDSERVAVALSSADGNQTGKIPKEQIYPALQNVIPDDILNAVLDSIDEDDDEVSIQRVIDAAHKEYTDTPTRRSLRGDDDDESGLLSPKDVVVPGGCNDTREKPKYVYDTLTDSLRDFEA